MTDMTPTREIAGAAAALVGDAPPDVIDPEATSFFGDEADRSDATTQDAAPPDPADDPPARARPAVDDDRASGDTDHSTDDDHCIDDELTTHDELTTDDERAPEGPAVVTATEARELRVAVERRDRALQRLRAQVAGERAAHAQTRADHAAYRAAHPPI